MTRVTIMAQGGMGAATAARLVAHGVEVRTVTAGRSAASAERAATAGMKSVSEKEAVAVDFFLSIVPPAEAIPLAERFAPHLKAAAKKPVYVDLNAVSPETAKKVAAVIEAAGAPAVDGGIIGMPPRPDGYSPVYYVSGDEAGRVAVLNSLGMKIGVLDAPVGAASALKMSYAGITKGLIGIGASMALAARRAGVGDALLAELATSQANLLAGFKRSVPDMFSKAGRWVGEMEEIAAYAGEGDRPEGEVYAALAELYERFAQDFAGEQREIGVLRDFFKP
jgi:3-hydroxyisobutyrate dehydrogenase-like beta-hydroxyacid dehydrogenase